MAIVCSVCNGNGFAVAAVSLLAIAATLGFVVWFAGRAGLSRMRALEVGLWGLAGAFWGGHLFVLLQNDPGSIAADPVNLVRIFDGAQSSIGAFVGASVFGLVVLLCRRQRFLAFADACAPAIAIGYAVARIACLLNGDDFGTASQVLSAVQFPQGSNVHHVHLSHGWIDSSSHLSLPVHPTQLYHLLLGLVGTVVLLIFRGTLPGQRFAAALAIYGAGRFVIQFFRGDSIPVWGPFDVNHIAALMMLIAGLMLWRLRPTRAAAREQPA